MMKWLLKPVNSGKPHSMNNIFDNFVALTSWVGELVIDIMVT
jgi:hypothetical protein